MSTTFAVKTSEDFAARYREFCERHNLAIGRFTEAVLREAMEDHYFAREAAAAMMRSSGKPRLTLDQALGELGLTREDLDE